MERGRRFLADAALAPPGMHEYRLIINGDWADHGEAFARVSNPFGGKNCVLTVRRS